MISLNYYKLCINQEKLHASVIILHESHLKQSNYSVFTDTDIPVFVVIVEIACPLILVTTLLLVVKCSTTLSVVIGLQLKVVWLSLTMVTVLFGCDTTEIFCWVYSILGGFIRETIDDSVIVEDEDEKTVIHSSAKVQ